MKGFKIPPKWSCKKVTGKKMAICSDKTKPKTKKGGRKTTKVKSYKYQKKVDTKRARKTPGTSKKTVKVKSHRRKK